MVTLGDRDQCRIVRINVATGAIERDGTLMAGRTSVVGVSLGRMMHCGAAGQVKRCTLLCMTCRAVKRGLADRCMTAGALVTRRRRGQMVHCRAAVSGRVLTSVAGGTIERGWVDISNALMTLCTIIVDIRLGRVMDLRQCGGRDDGCVTVLAGLFKRHRETPVRSIIVAIETTEAVCRIGMVQVFLDLPCHWVGGRPFTIVATATAGGSRNAFMTGVAARAVGAGRVVVVSTRISRPLACRMTTFTIRPQGHARMALGTIIIDKGL